MLLSHLGWLCTILPFLTAATPQATLSDEPQSSLPAKLQKDIPACAQPCLQKSLAEQFPLACTVPASLSCLCSTYSTDGESLGEVALGCIYASCSSVDPSAAEAYNICFSQADAARPTLTILTVVPAKASTTMSSSSPVATSEPPTITSSTTPPQVSSTETGTVSVDSVSSNSTPTSASSPTVSPSPTATAHPETQTMKPAQIIGLSVAAAATFLLAIGLIALSINLRKRNERRRKSESANEKSGMPSSPPWDHSNRFSQSFGQSQPTLDLTTRFPLPPVPAMRRPQRDASGIVARNERADAPPEPNHATVQRDQLNNVPTEGLNSVHPLLRPSIGTQNKTTDSSLPLDQIGLAISAEQPRKSTVTGGSLRPLRRLSSRIQKRRSLGRNSEASQRPDSDVTQYTVFEEDDVAEVPEPRRQSALLPTPPIPIPPFRSFQPSRPPPPPKFTLERPAQEHTQTRQPPQRSELFLDIPIRHSRLQPPKIMPTTLAGSGASTQRPQLAPAVQIGRPQKSVAMTATTPEPHHSGDIPDYYFSSHRYPTPKDTAWTNPSDLSQASKVKPKLASSDASRTTSRASTRIRDSFSSQTSFESADLDGPTPESENNGKLSPVAESPISNLRYPKVPRASNQLVPRSPRSPQSLKSQDSPYWLPEPSSMLVKRRGEQAARELDSPLGTGSPIQPDMRNHMRQYRQHLRSNSGETWIPIRTSERSTRTQSGMWPPKSPAMYEPDVVRPLSIRPKKNTQLLQTPHVEMEALNSPAWVPRLTPTRQGEDLLISVTYSKPGQ